jgi:hypothetical protein
MGLIGSALPWGCGHALQCCVSGGLLWHACCCRLQQGVSTCRVQWVLDMCEYTAMSHSLGPVDTSA